MASIYKYRTYQYNGPVLDQNMYTTPFLLTSGQMTEPINVQWVTDPSAACSIEQKRLQLRGGATIATQQSPTRVVSYQYRPFME